jgi:hypothetical protein
MGVATRRRRPSRLALRVAGMTPLMAEQPPPGRPPAPSEPEPGGPAVEREPATARTMLPARERRRLRAESALMRLVATAGVVGIGVALGAILVGQDVAGWIVGLAVTAVSVLPAAVLWSSRQL